MEHDDEHSPAQSRAVPGARRCAPSIEVPKLTPAYAPDEESKMSEEEIGEQDASDWLRSAEWRVSRHGEFSAS
jgi:hypothetical protein